MAKTWLSWVVMGVLPLGAQAQSTPLSSQDTLAVMRLVGQYVKRATDPARRVVIASEMSPLASGRIASAVQKAQEERLVRIVAEASGKSVRPSATIEQICTGNGIECRFRDVDVLYYIQELVANGDTASVQLLRRLSPAGPGEPIYFELGIVSFVRPAGGVWEFVKYQIRSQS